jgi:hypothetical protein
MSEVHEFDLRGDIGSVSVRDDFVGRQLFEHWLQEIIVFLLAGAGEAGRAVVTRHF